MSSSSRSSSKSDSENSVHMEELLEIGARCRELRKEKDMLRESQSESFELIRRLELHVKSLSEARAEDKKHIRNLERELMNCSQEIDSLQDQLHARNTEVNCLSKHVHSLELKLANMEDLQEQVAHLKDELKSSISERLLLMQELESKEKELHNSTLFVEKLEESISSLSLESQCEIESMKLDIMALEQTCLEAKKTQKDDIQEKAQMSELIDKLQVQFQHAQENIRCLDRENKELKEKLARSKMNTKAFCHKIGIWLDNNDKTPFRTESYLDEVESKRTISGEMRSSSSEVFNAILSKLALALVPDIDSEEKLKSMSHQIYEYELIVKQLKDELRKEKLKAKEEAEDLAQEMAELRYQITNLLEEERNRRACVEQASLQRIAELEAQIKGERRTSFSTCRHLSEA